MTVQTVFAGSGGRYGIRELRELYQRYATIALLIAVVAHLSAIGVYYMVGTFFAVETPASIVNKINIWQLVQPPSIMNTDASPLVRVSAPAVKEIPGVPVPVPDPEVRMEQTIPTQNNFWDTSPIGTSSGTGTTAGTVPAPPEVKIEDEDPPIFLPVELPPVPVKVVAPEYPDIAKRAGIEGTVWVRILVDKTGKAKKALIMKSDEDVFNQYAIDAALQFVFTPAMMNNGPVAVWASMPFRFKLNK